MLHTRFFFSSLPLYFLLCYLFLSHKQSMSFLNGFLLARGHQERCMELGRTPSTSGPSDKAERKIGEMKCLRLVLLRPSSPFPPFKFLGRRRPLNLMEFFQVLGRGYDGKM
ncbi:hypothetical protein QBC36DRAFT_137416 [Triangularia setosa]|uniref:Uncharacterized protein n=1 Tax=Triangularia setosa TaxID=2587417 RepID=A0AAN6WFP0_9PEZI|nr:hypothetical protein QBC36DRAFT_137416 [Podospora setosa]